MITQLIYYCGDTRSYKRITKLYIYRYKAQYVSFYIYERGTVHREYSGVTVGSGGIGSSTFVSSSMSRRHTVDAQEADSLISHNINIRPTRVDRDVVEGPHQFYREVALDDRARDRQHLAGVERIVAEGKLKDLWRDCVNDTAAQAGRYNKRQKIVKVIE